MMLIGDLRSTHYLLYLSPTRQRPAGHGARLSEGFLERNVFHFRVLAGLGQALLRSLRSNGEVDRESHLFLSSGPPLAKAWDENLGVKVGGLRPEGALHAKMDEKILALTSLLSFFTILEIKISYFSS